MNALECQELPAVAGTLNRASGRGDPATALRMRRILVPLDLSERSARTLRYAAAFASHFQAELALLYVVEPCCQGVEHGAPVGPLLDEAFLAQARGKLAGMAQAVAAPGTPMQQQVESGVPWKQIVEAARVQEADLIIITTHGYTGLKHAVLGSTAERVVQHAACPVLVVREPMDSFHIQP